MALVLQFLGTVQVIWEDLPLKFATDYSRALFAYLAVEAETIHQRTTLATLLWPDESESVARHNLRQALFFLKQSLRPLPQRDTILQITPTTVQWKQQKESDLASFQEHWRFSQQHNHRATHECALCIERFAQAVALYRGEFLQGLLLKNSQPFEEWALLLREQIHRQVMSMLDVLTAYHSVGGAFAQAQRYAERLVALEPWHEEAHRQLMIALAKQGQQGAALRQYESCRRILQQELGVAPSPKTTALYEQIRAGVLSTTPTLPMALLQAPPATDSAQLSKSKKLHNLPSFLTPLIGRSQQLAQLRTMLNNPSQRLITITGMGGMGKSRLALGLLEQLAAESPSPFADGFWFVPLVALSTSPNSDLQSALAVATMNSMQVNRPSQDDQLSTLCHFLAPRQILLCFDNLEDLLQEEAMAATTVEFLLALLQAAPQLKLLITSRLPLQLLMESLLRLEGLSLPARGETIGEPEESDSASVRLFAYHAQRTLPTFTLSHDNLPIIGELCRSLGGMPLAIELAAALTPHFTIAELVAAIRQNLALLVSTRRDMDARHRQFSAVLESSWQQLSPREQRILTQCSIFVGHFSRSAVQAVTGATIADLSKLIDKSLIQQIAVGEYQLHQLLRQFASDILQSSAEMAMEVAERHSTYYLDFVAQRNQPMARHAPRQTALEIQHELDNVRQAWFWTTAHLAHPAYSKIFCARLNRSLHAICQFYLFSCLYEEGIAALQQAVAGVQSLLKGTEPTVGEADSSSTEHVDWQRLLSKVLAFEALLVCFRGKFEVGLPLAEEAIAQSVACGSRAGEVIGLQAVGHVSYITGHFDEAKQYFRRVLHCIQQAESDAADEENRLGEIGHGAQVMTYIYLGVFAKIDDDYAQAADYFRQSLALCQSLGKVMGGLDARMNLADLARNKQRYAEALPDYEEVVRTAGKLSNQRAESIARYELADVLRGLGDYSQALQQFNRSLSLLSEFGDPLLETYLHSSLAMLYSYLGLAERAERSLQAAFQCCEPLTMPDAKPSVWLAAALHYHLTGNGEAALRYATQCRDYAQSQKSRHTEAIALLYLGLIAEAAAHWAEAGVHFQSALKLFESLDLLPSSVEAEAGLARIALAQGNPALAQSRVEAILLKLASQHTVGLDEPFLIYLTCYRVLTANDDGRAGAIFQQGAKELQRYAERITDDEMRRSFLENVRSHRALQLLSVGLVKTNSAATASKGNTIG